jgi:hypothetical protein
VVSKQPLHKSCVYTVSLARESWDDGCLQDVYNMRNGFTQVLRRDGLCQAHPILRESVDICHSSGIRSHRKCETVYQLQQKTPQQKHKRLKNGTRVDARMSHNGYLTLQSPSSSRRYLRIHSVPQTEHHTSPLQRSTG